MSEPVRPYNPHKPPPRPLGARHALYVGWVLGIAMRNGLNVEPVVDDDRNYTDRLTVRLDGVDITVIVPPPPADWSLNNE